MIRNFVYLFLYSLATLEASAQKISSHLLVCDPLQACEAGKEALRSNPGRKELLEAYILALAKAGKETEMLKCWNEYITLFPDQKENRLVLENMAWGVIEKGVDSDAPMIRLYTMIGARFGEDARGVEIIYQGMKDDSAVIRGLAIRLASGMKDAKLKDEIQRLFKEEKYWKLRLEIILALGKMEIASSERDLISLVSNDQSSPEEKAAAIQSLVYLIEEPKKEEIIPFIHSDRAGLRLLACKVLAHAELIEGVDLILPLLLDHNPQVRAEALYTIGVLRAGKQENIIPLLNDSNPQVAITAAWVMMLSDPSQGIKAFRPWLKNSKPEVRRFAAAALAASGKNGVPLVVEQFEATKDTYVKMNLALGLIGQRVKTEKASQTLYEGFITLREPWKWESMGPFRALAPSDIDHSDLIPNYPEAVNLQTRLDILNILAIMEHPNSIEAIRSFLKRKHLGIPLMASTLLLTEADESALELVENLLDDSDPKIRVQAALILSIWGGGERALATLQETYYTADRELKEMILEGLGNIGSNSTIPFLVERLGESYQSLRIIAASSLLKTLYH